MPDWKDCKLRSLDLKNLLYRENQNCMPEISVPRYKLSRLAYMYFGLQVSSFRCRGSITCLRKTLSNGQ